MLRGYYVAEYRISCKAGTMGGHAIHSACWRLASIELPESWQRARGWRRWGGATWLICYQISHYLQSWDSGWTRNPLCLVAAREYRAARELAESSWMATMGVLHGYDVAQYTAICRAKSRGRARPHASHTAGWLPESRSPNRRAGTDRTHSTQAAWCLLARRKAVPSTPVLGRPGRAQQAVTSRPAR